MTVRLLHFTASCTHQQSLSVSVLKRNVLPGLLGNLADVDHVAISNLFFPFRTAAKIALPVCVRKTIAIRTFTLTGIATHEMADLENAPNNFKQSCRRVVFRNKRFRTNAKTDANGGAFINRPERDR